MPLYDIQCSCIVAHTVHDTYSSIIVDIAYINDKDALINNINYRGT